MPTRATRPILLTLLATSLLAPAANATERLLTLDPEHTAISFSLGATGHDVHGRLALDRGTVGFDDESGRAWGEITIDVRHAETGNMKRDRAMHGKVLESDAHPLITFAPDRFEGALALTGPSEIRLAGTVTLLGVAHPLVVPAQATVDGNHVTATATFSVPYVDWGLHDPSKLVLRVAKQVEVTLELEGSLADTEAPVPSSATGGTH
jgi:polyisoprenoid-binding protein YceI